MCSDKNVEVSFSSNSASSKDSSNGSTASKDSSNGSTASKDSSNGSTASKDSSNGSTASKDSRNESTASSVNCVTVSDNDVSVSARKKTKLSTKSIRTSYTQCICYSFFFENTKIS